MNEIKCPACGKVFSVDEASYASVVNQVRTKEFNDEVQRRMAEIVKEQQLKQQSDKLLAEQGFQRQINAMNQEIEKRNADIARLQERIKGVEVSKDAEFAKLLAAKDATILELKNQVAQRESQTKLAVLQEQNKAKEEIHRMERDIVSWKERLTAEKNDAAQREQNIRSSYDLQLKQKQDMIDYYKDLKVKLSTKMVGETLEAHCNTLFNTTIRPIMTNAYFEKDNDASSGSKGDFIFRDYDDGYEYISIMFEMKNEMDETATKHKNEDFFKKLNDDRNQKGCEYAVLVSLLEPESELYNTGIVDVSHRYEKMYVIRPQFFIPLITLLVQASRKSIALQRQLELAQNQSIDVTNFESKLEDFKDKFGRNYRLASEKFEAAIAEIDRSIDHLLKIKNNLLGADNNLRLANNKAEELTIKKLTYNNPTMKAKFAEARKNAPSAEAIEDAEQ